MQTLIALLFSVFAVLPMGKRVTVPLALGGQFSAGNAASNPDGTVRALNNHLTRPGRLPARPPFVYDNLMAINGLTNFDDTTNRVRRLLAINTSQQVFEKGTTGETWGAANATTISGARLTDSADYRGTTYMMFDDGTGLPSGAASFDGTNVSTSPFSSAIQGRTITTFDERLYLAYPRVTVTNLLAVTASPTNTLSAYALDNATYWTPTNVTATSVTESGATIVRLTPNSTAASACKIIATSAMTASVLPSSTSEIDAVGTIFLRNNSTTDMPITLEVFFSSAGTVAYPGGSVPQNFVFATTVAGVVYIFQATTGGTVGAAPPAWNAAVGSTTADNTVVWTNIGIDTLGQSQTTCIADGQWHRYDVPVIVNKTHNSLKVGLRLKFYNDAHTALTSLVTIDASSRDGLADGDVRKSNYGWQLTSGDFHYPFFNSESTNAPVIDMDDVVWSEIGIPKTVRASNTYKLREAQGRATAATAIGGRLMVAKRNAIWQFQDTGDPDIPIRREKFMAGIGVTGPRAHDKFEDEWFFVGENDCYRYKVGDDIPKPFCGDGMRETVMAKGANWVESQSTYKQPLLAIDQQQLIVWVYTQKGKLFAYDLRSNRWSTHYVSGNVEIDAMLWNPNTGNFYVSFGGHGLTRMDYAANASDTIDNTATPLALDKSFVLPPLKISTLRFDAYCEGIKFLYATANPSLQSVTASISYDQGGTYPNSVNYTPFLASTNGDFVPITLDICESGPSVTLRVAASGPGGEGSWSLADEMEMKLKINRGEYPQVNPTAGSSNL